MSNIAEGEEDRPKPDPKIFIEGENPNNSIGGAGIRVVGGKNIVIAGNHSHDNWGDGISVTETENAIIRGNFTENNGKRAKALIAKELKTIDQDLSENQILELSEGLYNLPRDEKTITDFLVKELPHIANIVTVATPIVQLLCSL